MTPFAASRGRIRVLLEKELRELVATRMLLASVVLLPLLLSGVALTMAWATGAIPPPEAASPEAIARDMAEMRHLIGPRIELFSSPRDALQLYLSETGLLVILLLPALLPPILAAQTLVREKIARSLETLLVTPVRTWEIVVAKVLFCAGLGVIPMWLAAAAYYGVVGARCSTLVLSLLAAPGWLTMVILGSPLVALAGVGAAVAVSSRAKDAQTAQQVAGMVVLPLIGLLAMHATGVASLDGTGALVFVGILALVDTVVLALAVSLFERETVVTRWK